MNHHANRSANNLFNTPPSPLPSNDITMLSTLPKSLIVTKCHNIFTPSFPPDLNDVNAAPMTSLSLAPIDNDLLFDKTIPTTTN